MDCRSLGLVFFDQEDRHGGQQHEDPGERQHVGRVGGEAVLDDGTAGQSTGDKTKCIKEEQLQKDR